MKVQNPIIGRARGSAGGMTFCKNYDKNVARAKAFEVANPKTAAQTTQRNYFKELTALVATFTEEQLRFLFPNKPKAMSRRNALAKQLAEYFTLKAGVKSVDYDSIDTIGNASTLDNLDCTANFGDGFIEVTLNAKGSIPDELQDFLFTTMIVNVTKKQMSLPLPNSTVDKGIANYAIPEGWEQGDTLNGITLITNTKDALVGFGTMYVVKRPAKANA
jgi:hypothetical protein